MLCYEERTRATFSPFSLLNPIVPKGNLVYVCCLEFIFFLGHSSIPEIMNPAVV